MWKNTSKWLMAFAQKNPDCLAVIVDFVFLTMRENTAKLTNITKLYGKNKHNIPSFNMKFRKKGSAYMWKNRKRIYKDMMSILDSDMSDFQKETELYRVFCQIDYINTAKAGFIMALATPYGGCFDLHNLAKFNVDKMDIYLDKKNSSMYHETMVIYRVQKHLERIGGRNAITDSWCIDCSTREPELFPTPEDMCHAHIIWIKEMAKAINA